jgi:outer membrane receptor for ferrienterochelin and colicin
MEESRVYGLEATFQPIPELRLNASTFLSNFDDLIVSVSGWGSQNRPSYQNLNVPRARYESYAVEANIELLSWLTVRTSASKTNAENRTPGNEIPTLIDYFGSGPTEKIFVSSRIPYVPERTGSVILQFRPKGAGLTIDTSAQFTGTMLIQQSNRLIIDPFGLDTQTFAEVPSFWVMNLRVTKTLPRGVELFAGLDNFQDYIQPDLAWPSTDYTWGPLRGRYYYGGMSFGLER